jgi:translation initiation factor IF-1
LPLGRFPLRSPEIERLRKASLSAFVAPLTANSSTSTESKGTSHIEVEGRIVAVLPGTMFRVQLSNGHIVLGHISGKLRKHFIKIAAGDMVKMEMSPYDTEKARITFRIKDTSSTYRPPARRRY